MKKMISAVTIASLLVTLIACSSSAKPLPENTTEPTMDISQPISSSEDVGESNSTTIVEGSALLDEDGLKMQFEQVANACADMISSFVIDFDKGSYPLPTLEEYATLSEIIGEFGHPVDYYEFDMPNHEKVLTFVNDTEEGKEAQLIVYRLFNWGIAADVLESRSGGIFYRWYVCSFPSYGDPDRKPEFVYDGFEDEIDSLHMGDNGFLFYYAPNKGDQSESYRGYRILPLGEENREYTRKYVEWLGDAPGSILGETWDEDNLDDLSMIHVFESLYYKMHEDFPEEYAIAHPTDGEVIRQIPADVVEGIMLNSLPLTIEQLRTYISYEESEQVYQYHIAIRSSMGYYDVVKSVKNADSSLTLTIEVVPVYYDYRDVRTYNLTVKDNPEGSIKYISNVVVER